MVTNMADSSKVHMQCDQSRTHKLWAHNLRSKVFSTREEAEYHEALCGHGDCSRTFSCAVGCCAFSDGSHSTNAED